MALPNYLAKIKSSGIYRFVWDKSEIPGEQAETLRLVVGYSEKGPFNTLVYIDSTSKFKTVYGNISKKLERYGCFFHRLAMQALASGPIIALNLKTFGETEKCGGFAIDPNDSLFDDEDTELTNALNTKVREIYNTDRFWKLEPEHLEDLADVDNKYIILTHTDSNNTTNTVFMRGFVPSNYNITFKEWYSSVLNGADMPDYIYNTEKDFSLRKLDQYFAEIYVFRGVFTPEICTSENLAKYFVVDGDTVTLRTDLTNAFNEPIDTLEALSQNSASNFINKYQGILLPDFQSSTGSVLSLDQLFNNDFDNHKMMMRLNQAALYDGLVDLDDITTTGWRNTVFSQGCHMMSVYLTASDVNANTTSTTNGVDYNPELPAPYFTKLGGCTVSGNTATFTQYGINMGFAKGQYFLADNTNSAPYTCVLTDVEEVPTTNVYVRYTEGGTTVVSEGYGVFAAGNVTLDVKEDTLIDEEADAMTGTVSLTPQTGTENRFEVTIDNTMYVIEKREAHRDDFTTVTLTFDSNVYDDVVNTTHSIVRCDRSLTDNTIGMQPFTVAGYTPDPARQRPVNTTQLEKNKWINTYILSALSDDEYKGIREGLTNNVDSEWHYLVDTFEAFVEPECHARLAAICKMKDNALGLLNFPKIKSFSTCTYTFFTDGNDNFDTKYIAMGGNPNKSRAVVFSLASEDNGASFVSYNTPVLIDDGATGLRITVPAAGIVSNAYMRKYDNRFPYSIVAGPNYGALYAQGLIGPDYNFSRYDRDILEPFGVNCTVYEPRKGTFINSNQTAKQNPVTTLSKINVRELVIFLQDEIEKLLQDYQWEFNTQTLRDTVKSRADVILEKAKNNGGVYKYFNVCDESNNTDDVINNEMLVLSTSIEPGLGAGKMVQELTIYRTGGMTSVIK